MTAKSPVSPLEKSGNAATDRRLLANAIRALAMDAVQKANSGHPGTPMALAPLAHVLWTRIMNYDASCVEMIPFERGFQTFHSLQNYFLLNELLAPGLPMPIVDGGPLRRARAAFVARFCERPYWFIRAATPQVLMDAVDEVL